MIILYGTKDFGRPWLYVDRLYQMEPILHGFKGNFYHDISIVSKVIHDKIMLILCHFREHNFKQSSYIRYIILGGFHPRETPNSNFTSHTYFFSLQNFYIISLNVIAPLSLTWSLSVYYAKVNYFPSCQNEDVKFRIGLNW
jgi:hypothetical protein